MLTGFNGTSMPNWPMSDDKRWALAAWLNSIQRRRTDTQDRVVVAKRTETLPTTIDGEQWASLPRVMFPLVGQVVEKPRLFWPSVTEIFVQAAYDDENNGGLDASSRRLRELCSEGARRVNLVHNLCTRFASVPSRRRVRRHCRRFQRTYASRVSWNHRATVRHCGCSQLLARLSRRPG